MPPKLYMTLISPPVRAVLLCAKAIDLELELIEVNLFTADYLKPEFIKLNPVHTIPTLDDDGFVLCDSHAIMGYLVGKYAKDKSLYPDDVKKRARIDQRLHFDNGILFARHAGLCFPIVTHGITELDEEKREGVIEAFGFLEAFLQDTKYVAGDTLSIADFSIISTITNASIAVPLDEKIFPNIAAWRKLMETLPYYELNRAGGELFIDFLASKLSKK